MSGKTRIFQVDAFTDRLFAGNPAAVCPLERWLDDATLGAIAAENNLSETAFLVREGAGFGLRWFTPTVEMDLCGHATLAAAHVVFRFLDPSAQSVTFASKSGPLVVERHGELLAMRFPRREPAPCAIPPELLAGLGGRPLEVLRSRDYMVVYGSEAEVRALDPDQARLAELDAIGVIATAAGSDVDFVSRFFAPRAGIAEDPVTGSAHCTLTPYWSQKLGKRQLRARQLSARGGELLCEDAGDSVLLSGRAVLYLQGTLEL